MKRIVAIELEQMRTKLSGYVGIFNYNLLNLCVEAEAVALLSAKIMTEDGEKNMEDVAKVAVDKKYHFIIDPIYDDELQPIAKGIMKVHPEFKQEVKTWEGYDESDPAGKYIYCTMPEVNKDRRDVMNNAVDVLYNKCKADMEAANAKATAKIATHMAGSSDREIETVKNLREKNVQQFEEMRERLHTDKLKEIEDAYQEYLTKQVEQHQVDQEREEAEGNPTSMRLNSAD